jgi:hypothetical protein
MQLGHNNCRRCQDAALDRLELSGGGIEITDEILDWSVRRNNQNPSLAQFEEIWALDILHLAVGCENSTPTYFH